MRIFIAMLICSSSGWAQPYPLLKKGEELAPAVPPQIYRATAVEVKGEVVIKLRSRNDRITDKKDADNVTLMAYVWEDTKPLTLGKDVKAYSQGGKSLDKAGGIKRISEADSGGMFRASTAGRSGEARSHLRGYVPRRCRVSRVPREVAIAVR